MDSNAKASNVKMLLSFAYGVAGDVFMVLAEKWDEMWVKFHEGFNNQGSEVDKEIAKAVEDIVDESMREWTLKVKIVQIGLKLVNTCPNLSKLVQTFQTCPNLSKLEFNKYILYFRYQPIQMCFKVPSFNPGQTFQKVLIQYLLSHYMKVASAKSL